MTRPLIFGWPLQRELIPLIDETARRGESVSAYVALLQRELIPLLDETLLEASDP